MKRRKFIELGIQIGALAGPFFWLTSQAQAGVQFFKSELLRFSKKVYFSDSQKFLKLKKIVNQLIDPMDPMAIVQTEDLTEIQEITKYCAESSIPLRVRSGGHSFESFSVGEGVVIDTRRLKTIEIDVNNDWVKVGAGVTLGELRTKLDQNGFGFPTGSCPSVGVAGYLLGGGHSRQSRLWGLGADRVQAMDIIDSTGQLYRVSPKNHGELYWALLGGGGGNFATVTAFYLDIIEKVEVVSFSLRTSDGEFSAIYDQWEEFILMAADSVTANLFISISKGKISQLRVAGMISLDPSDARDPQTVFEQSLPASIRDQFEKSQTRVRRIKNFSGPQEIDAETFFKGSSQYADQPIGVNGFEFLEKTIESHLSDSLSGVIEINPMGGKILKPDRENSYPHRQALYSMGIFLQIERNKNIDLLMKDSSDFRDELGEIFSGRHYVNYPDLSLSTGSDRTWAEAYYGQSLPQLMRIKKQTDPKGLFNFGAHCLSSLNSEI